MGGILGGNAPSKRIFRLLKQEPYLQVGYGFVGAECFLSGRYLLICPPIFGGNYVYEYLEYRRERQVGTNRLVIPQSALQRDRNTQSQISFERHK